MATDWRGGRSGEGLAGHAQTAEPRRRRQRTQSMAACPPLQAYQALTDETSRENYQKYGHPDGPQAYSVRCAGGGCVLAQWGNAWHAGKGWPACRRWSALPMPSDPLPPLQRGSA